MTYTISRLIQRIVGKSIPMERFSARKVKKYRPAFTVCVRTGLRMPRVFVRIARCAHQRHTSEGAIQELKYCRGKEREYVREYKKRGAENKGY